MALMFVSINGVNIVANKIKLPQKEEFTGRDNFRTPRYATELLIPFLGNLTWRNNIRVWECAAGLGHIANVLTEAGLFVWQSDIIHAPNLHDTGDFLKDEIFLKDNYEAIVTNPPFSLKQKFYERCMKLGKPFALLIPCDISGWIIDAMKNNCEKIIPERRVDYLTPNQLQNINDKIVLKSINDGYYTAYKKKNDVDTYIWDSQESRLMGVHALYSNLEDVPIEIVRKNSSSMFHSMWLTYGLNIGKQETYVELTNEMKNNIFQKGDLFD